MLTEHHDELDLARRGFRGQLAVSLLTPRFETSRHVVGLIFCEGEDEPCLVAKIPRRPGDNEGVEREAEMLRALQDSAPAPIAGVPAVIGFFDLFGHGMLVETALRGKPMDPDRVSHDFRHALQAGVEFIFQLPVTAEPRNNTNWYDVTVRQPLAQLIRLAPMGGRMAALVSDTHDFLEPLAAQALPAIFEHADLSHPNLLLSSSGSLQVADWERSRRLGVPAHDLVFFLQYLSESRRSAFTRVAQADAFDAAFTASDAWAVAVGHRYLAKYDVSRDMLPYLVIAAWARSTSTLIARLVPAEDQVTLRADMSGMSDMSAVVAADRDFMLWQHALTQRHALLAINSR